MPNVRERASSGVESKMAPKQNALGLVDASRNGRRPPLIGIQFLHEDPAGPEADVGVVRDNARHSNSKPSLPIIRQRLIKIGARVIEHVARIRVPATNAQTRRCSAASLGLMPSGP